jgi:hypothetical protein
VEKLLAAASTAAGLAAGVVPVFAQSVVTNAPGRFATADSGRAGSIRVQNHNQVHAPITKNAHVGEGSRPDYLMHQEEHGNMPGYSIPANG